MLEARQATTWALELVPAMKSFRIDQLYLYALGRAEMELKPMNFPLATPDITSHKQPPKSSNTKKKSERHLKKGRKRQEIFMGKEESTRD